MTNFLEPWYAALRAKVGIAITTNDIAICKQKLYADRKKANDPALAGLSIVISPINPESELWIVKRNDGPEQQQPDETLTLSLPG